MKRISACLVLALSIAMVTASTMPALAQVEESEEEAKPEPPKADGGWLGWCIDTRGGTTLADAPCYVEYREALVAEQDVLLGRIYKALAGKGPSGTDYTKAADRLRAAQVGWRSQVDGDCDALSYVFGTGTALGLAGEDCIISHYLERNVWLSDFEKEWLQQ